MALDSIAADALAWDFFFALSMLFAAYVFKIGKLEKTIRIFMIASGALSLVGLFGLPFLSQTPLIRNIGIVGYVGVSQVVFFLLAVVFGRSKQETKDTRPNSTIWDAHTTGKSEDISTHYYLRT